MSLLTNVRLSVPLVWAVLPLAIVRLSGTLNLREWTMQEWTMRHDMARVDIAAVDNAGVVKSAIWIIIIGYFNNDNLYFTTQW